MKYKFKEGVFFNTFEDSTNLKLKILDFICEDKANKIIYKGDPMEINYKMLRKVLPDKKSNHIKDLNLEEENLRIAFGKFIEKIKSKHCIIYKK
jgi:hypothetical protein